MKLGAKLGADPVKHGALLLDKYVIDDAPAVPARLRAPYGRYPFGMLGNDQYGDCVEAAMLHMDEAFYLRRGLAPQPYGVATATALYSVIAGFDPTDPATDQGTDPAEAMAHWVKVGLPGHKLDGFGYIAGNSPTIRRAIWEFGCVMLVVALPIGAQTQGVHWRGNNLGQPGSWGGHAIMGDGFDPHMLYMCSWGEQGDVGNQFADVYLEGAYVPLSREVLDARGVGPAGFNFAQMSSDLPPA